MSRNKIGGQNNMNMKKIFFNILIIGILFSFTGCVIQRAINMKDCKYSFGEITSVTWANINFLQFGTNLSNFNVKTLTDFATAIAKKDFATRITLNINAQNPKSQDAALAGFDYQVYYKDFIIGEGESINSSEIVVPAYGETKIPANLQVSFKDVVDLKQPVKSVENTLAFIKSITKIGKEKTDFSIKIRPHIRIGQKKVKTAYITLDI